jgi:ribose 1,5-bisphosphate isomerase
MDLNTTVKKIRSLEIQGATNISKAAIKSLSHYAKNSNNKSRTAFLRDIDKARKKLSSSRPTEPEMRNLLDYIYKNLVLTKSANVSELKKQTIYLCNKALELREKSLKKLISYGSKLITKGSIVYTHCHSSSVTRILKQAFKKRKFEVYNTETRPLFQGRLTAKELSSFGIPVRHFIDSAMRIAIKESDIVLLGADSITSTKVINKIGSELAAEIAHRYDIPVYICASSWKFNHESIYGKQEIIEQRNRQEVWPKAPKKVKISNYAFENISFDNITAIISDLGILDPETFIQEAKDKILK